jgi:pSer/pThr/pTyr-binding forkhead associated (FHA) protein
MRAGRDGAACQILLNEPRVSGTHATLKFEGGQLLVRDENSNNGTFVNGGRIPAMTWTPIPPGGSLKFGPVEFSVRLE